MHRLVLFWFVVSLTSSEAIPRLQALFREHASAKGTECLPEVGATTEELKSIVGFGLPTTKTGMCLITCIHQKFGMQNSDGTMNEAGTLAFLEQVNDDPAYYALVKDLFTMCLRTVSNDDEKCVIGSNLMGCLVLNGKKTGVFDS